MSYQDPETPGKISIARTAVAAAVVVGGVLVLLIIIFGLWGAMAAFSRYQKRANAANNVRVTATQIRNYEQRANIEKQKAQIRFIQSTGIRKSQDEIAKTLTPLYVQFEMVQALEQIAASGRNSSVVFIPSGAAGIPLVSNALGQVQAPVTK
jgi:lipopolysaccharide export LptBFGC system permease protein LptF